MCLWWNKLSGLLCSGNQRWRSEEAASWVPASSSDSSRFSVCQILQVSERQMCGDSPTLIRLNQCHTVTTGQLEASLVTQCLSSQLRPARTLPDLIWINWLLWIGLETGPFRGWWSPFLEHSDFSHKAALGPVVCPIQCSLCLCKPSCVVNSGPSGPPSLGWSCDIYFSPLETRQPPPRLQRIPCPAITDGNTPLICFSISCVQTV